MWCLDKVPEYGVHWDTFLKKCFVKKCKVTHFWKFSSLAQIYLTGCCIHMSRQNILFSKLNQCLRGLNFSVSRCPSLPYIVECSFVVCNIPMVGPNPLSSRHLRNEYRQKPFFNFDYNKNCGYRESWDSQMWESWDTMGELGHVHRTWVMAQLSHIGRVGPLCGRVGPCHDNLFYPWL